MFLLFVECLKYYFLVLPISIVSTQCWAVRESYCVTLENQMQGMRRGLLASDISWPSEFASSPQQYPTYFLTVTAYHPMASYLLQLPLKFIV